MSKETTKRSPENIIDLELIQLKDHKKDCIDSINNVIKDIEVLIQRRDNIKVDLERTNGAIASVTRIRTEVTDESK